MGALTLVLWKIAFGSRFLICPGFLMLVLIQQMSSHRRNPHFLRHWATQHCYHYTVAGHTTVHVPLTDRSYGLVVDIWQLPAPASANDAMPRPYTAANSSQFEPQCRMQTHAPPHTPSSLEVSLNSPELSLSLEPHQPFTTTILWPFVRDYPGESVPEG